MYKYIGIDISKATLDLFDGSKSYKFENNENGFQEILQHFGTTKKEKQSLCLIFEPTGIYAYDLISFCHRQRIKAFIVGSKEAREYARSIKQRSKTDKIDAQVLYRYQTQIMDKMMSVPSLNISSIKLTQRRNLHDKYQTMIQQLKNLYEATDKKDRTLISTIEKEIKRLEKSAAKLFDDIKKLIFQEEKNEIHFKNLQTIPGIAQKSALSILLEVVRYPGAKVKEMTALMGLDPVFRDSGTFKGKVRISKQGGKRFREKLYMSCVVAIKHNARLKAFYEGLVSRGKPKKLALLAVMRKLLVIALAVVRNKEPYRALV